MLALLLVEATLKTAHTIKQFVHADVGQAHLDLVLNHLVHHELALIVNDHSRAVFRQSIKLPLPDDLGLLLQEVVEEK